MDPIPEQLHLIDRDAAGRSDIRGIEARLASSGLLNHRQLSLVANALRNPAGNYTVESHRTSHGVVYETARTDLLDLVAKGLLSKGKRGRTFIFRPQPNIEEALDNRVAENGRAG